MNQKVIDELEKLVERSKYEYQYGQDYGFRMTQKGKIFAFDTAIALLKKEENAALDLTAPECVEIRIKNDGKVVWVNTENGCQFRACQIKHLELVDERK